MDDLPGDGFGELLPLVRFMCVFGTFHFLQFRKRFNRWAIVTAIYSGVVLGASWIALGLNIPLYRHGIHFDVLLISKICNTSSAALQTINVSIVFYILANPSKFSHFMTKYWEHRLARPDGKINCRKITIIVYGLITITVLSWINNIRSFITTITTNDDNSNYQNLGMIYPLLNISNNTAAAAVSIATTEHILGFITIGTFWCPILFFVCCCMLVHHEFSVFTDELGRQITEIRSGSAHTVTNVGKNLEESRQVYEKLCEMVAALDNCFSTFIGVNLLISMPLLCFTIFGMVKLLAYSALLADTLVRVVYMFLVLTAVCLVPAKINSAVSSHLILLSIM
jgi:hypothetical protein